MSNALVLEQISFDDDLPISAWRDEIAAAIRDHQVVIVAGETGSGKTTQLPKICLQAGRKSIGHTQPRRIAARSVAERIAEELHTELGELVGYQVRFTRKSSAATKIKVMTDGVLLAEIGHDRDLRRYDTIIIDEAHERSLNIDFLLGYLKQLIARRPELKVIVTSATIDTERFSEHFDGAPIIEVSGRSYPVEVRYRPIYDNGTDTSTATDPDRDQIDAICDAVNELGKIGNGDILVFLSGEREIRDTADALTGMKLRFTEILPLYARLSAAEQHRVFSSHTGRRIVLATNVAETSLTVPGIRYVIDAGTARISRYSARTKVQRLPIEPISQASANQRAGRCGRVAPGVCIRLYSEDDFNSRPEFTDPEVLRTNLASVILQLTAARLGAIASFPFVEPPDSSQITDGIRLLDELGALSDKGNRNQPRLTDIGRQLARIPLDPRLGRMLLAAEQQGCLREVIIIVSGLSIQDPRERPAEHREAADTLHRRFWAPPVPEGSEKSEIEADGSDFLAVLRLWDYLRSQQKSLSGNAFRRMCRSEYLHFLRIREWQDLHAQLRDITRELKLNRNDQPASPDRIHTAILTGLLSQVGLADVRDDKASQLPARKRARLGPREYLGARGAKFAINPGSSVAKTQPPLVMAGELVETSRLWARTVAGVQADWIEEVAPHALKRHYSEPHWSKSAGSVLAYEQVSLYGVPIISQRRVSYGRIDPVVAREIFIRSALVEGLWRTRHHFFHRNEELRAEVAQLEERTRRRDLLVDDQTIFDFYAARVPEGIVSVAHFDAWWKKQRHIEPDRLTLTLADLVVRSTDSLALSDFPDSWPLDDHDFPISYSFEPGTARDGVTVEIPLALLNQLDPESFSWQVRGLRTELATELIRSLPKAIRTKFVPAPDHAARATRWLTEQQVKPGTEPFAGALGRALRALTGELVDAEHWRPAEVPAHLRITFVITDHDSVVAEGKDLAELKLNLASQLSETLNTAAQELTVSGASDWQFGEIDAELEIDRGGHQAVGFPGLVDEGNSVGLKVFEDPTRQRQAHRLGLRRLVMINTPDPTRWVVSHLNNLDKLALGHSPYAGVPALLADARLASVGELIIRHSGKEPVRTEPVYRRLLDLVRADNADLMRAIVTRTAEILRLYQGIQNDLGAARASAPDSVADIEEQLSNLIFSGFLAATDHDRLADLVRYLTGVRQRLVTLRTVPAKDAAGLAAISRCEDAYADLCRLAPPGPLPIKVEEVGWLLEEFRIGLFAQGLGTRVPVSEKRIMAAIAQATQQLNSAAVLQYRP